MLVYVPWMGHANAVAIIDVTPKDAFMNAEWNHHERGDGLLMDCQD